MEIIYQAGLTLHIASGTIALFSGSFIMVLSKSGKNHRSLGKVFFASMAGVFLTSLYMSLVTENWFLLCVGFFSFYLAASGYRVLHFKTVTAWKQPISLVDHFMGIGGLLAGAGLWLLAGILFSKGNLFGAVPAVFGTISSFTSYRNYRLFVNPPNDKKYWIRSHALRMTGAFAATVTAFVVVNAQIEQQWILWLLPTAIITPIGYYQLKEFLNKKQDFGNKNEFVKGV